MSRDPNREQSDIDNRPLGEATKEPPSKAEPEGPWLQVKDARPGVQVNARTGKFRYPPCS